MMFVVFVVFGVVGVGWFGFDVYVYCGVVFVLLVGGVVLFDVGVIVD